MLPQLHYGPGLRYCLLKRGVGLSSDRGWRPVISAEADKSYVELPVDDNEIQLQYGVASCSDEGRKLPEVTWQYSPRTLNSMPISYSDKNSNLWINLIFISELTNNHPKSTENLFKSRS
jgi:hypothetical protein